jgi:hypothetical protein
MAGGSSTTRIGNLPRRWTMSNRRLIAALAGAVALLFLAGCGDSTAPELLTADDADVLAAKPATPPGKDKQPPPGDKEPEVRHDIYFISNGSDPTVIPLCVVDDTWTCMDSNFQLTWVTVVTEVLDFHQTHRRFDMIHRLEIYGVDQPVGGFMTSNSITCREMPCSTSGVRLHRRNWVPLEDEGLVMPFDGHVNLVQDSELLEGGDGVVFVAGYGGIHGRVVFNWTSPDTE